MDGASHCLMATTLEAAQQHHFGVRGVAFDRFSQRPNRGAVAEQRSFHASPRVGEELLRHSQLSRELRVPRLELPAQALQRDMRVDAREHLVALKGFRHEIDRADFEPAHLVFGVVERRKEDHGSLAGFRVLFQPPARLVPVDPRHDDVEQDEHGVHLARHLDGVLSAPRHEQPVAAAVERVAQDVEVRGVVIDQQDAVGIFSERGLGLVHASSKVTFLPAPLLRADVVCRRDSRSSSCPRE